MVTVRDDQLFLQHDYDYCHIRKGCVLAIFCHHVQEWHGNHLPCHSKVDDEEGKISKLQEERTKKAVPNINILNGLGAPSYDLQPSAQEPDQNNPDKYFNMDWDKLKDVVKNNIWYTNGIN